MGSLAAALVAGGTGAWAGVCNLAGEDAARSHDKGKFQSFQTQQKIGYGLTIGLGALSVASLVLYLVTGREVDPDLAAVPGGLARF